MKVPTNFTKKSLFTGKVNTMTITLDPGDYNAWIAGILIQDALPYLTPDEREFLMTGCTPEEWRALMKDEVW